MRTQGNHLELPGTRTRCAPARYAVFAGLALALAGCTAETGSDPLQPTPPASPGPEYVPYESTWVAADSVWVKGVRSGEFLAYVPDDAEANRTLLYNVTLVAGAGITFRAYKDDVEIGSMPLAMGENRLELPAEDAARYSYDFPGSPAGAGSVRVAMATRGWAPREP